MPRATTSCGRARISPEQADVALLDLAESEVRIVLTLDKDFWQIAVQRRTPLEQSGVVLFRVHPATPERPAPLVRAFCEADATWCGHISIVKLEGIQKVKRPLRLRSLRLAREEEIFATRICPRLQVVNQPRLPARSR